MLDEKNIPSIRDLFFSLESPTDQLYPDYKNILYSGGLSSIFPHSPETRDSSLKYVEFQLGGTRPGSTRLSAGGDIFPKDDDPPNCHPFTPFSRVGSFVSLFFAIETRERRQSQRYYLYIDVF